MALIATVQCCNNSCGGSIAAGWGAGAAMPREAGGGCMPEWPKRDARAYWLSVGAKQGLVGSYLGVVLARNSADGALANAESKAAVPATCRTLSPFLNTGAQGLDAPWWHAQPAT